jgi:hypothetical protein
MVSSFSGRRVAKQGVEATICAAQARWRRQSCNPLILLKAPIAFVGFSTILRSALQ